MARIKHNLIAQGTSGGLERKFLFKHYGKITIISSFPDRSGVKLTEKQKKENHKFKQAMMYARNQMADPAAKAEYAAKAKGLQKPHNVAIADYYHPPEIKSIDVTGFRGESGDTVIIHAVDDFKVVRVRLEVTGTQGIPLESGEASQIAKWKWAYKVSHRYDGITSLRIIATAWDKPGNMTTLEIEVKR